MWFCSSFPVVLGTEPRASYLLGKCSSLEPCPWTGIHALRNTCAAPCCHSQWAIAASSQSFSSCSSRGSVKLEICTELRDCWRSLWRGRMQSRHTFVSGYGVNSSAGWTGAVSKDDTQGQFLWKREVFPVSLESTGLAE